VVGGRASGTGVGRRWSVVGRRWSVVGRGEVFDGSWRLVGVDRILISKF